MTEAATRILATFDTLPPQEQREVLVTMLRRTQAMPDTPLGDDELIAIADQLFQSLDTEEAHGSNPASW